MKIIDLELPIRVINALHSQNIINTAQLVRYRRDDLRLFPQIGDWALDTIQRELRRHDLRLSGDIS